MNNDVGKKIENFVDTLPEVIRKEMVHGTLYVKLEDDRVCDIIHTEIRNYYKDNINPEGGVNMYAVGDEFAFDFVPADRETPVFSDEEEKGIWSEFAEEELENNMPDDVDTLMNLEEESKRGK